MRRRCRDRRRHRAGGRARLPRRAHGRLARRAARRGGRRHEQPAPRRAARARCDRTSRSARSAGTSTRASARSSDGEYDAAVLAAAGIRRLGLEEVVTEWLSDETMLPAPGQGALAIQCRADDDAVLALLAELDDPAARAETTAERAFLRALGGGCAAPVAALAVTTTTPRVRLQGLVASVDGRHVVRVTGEGEPSERRRATRRRGARCAARTAYWRAFDDQPAALRTADRRHATRGEVARRRARAPRRRGHARAAHRDPARGGPRARGRRSTPWRATTGSC